MSEWTLVYEGFDPAGEGLREALCTLGNGYFATRGAAPEMAADGVHYPGTYVAGLYNRVETEIAGRVIENEDLVNAPNWLPLQIRVLGQDRWLQVGSADLEDYRQVLDMQRGVLTRTFTWIDAEGRRTGVTQRRFASMRNPHIAALETTVRPDNWSGRLEVRTALDGTVTNSGVPRYRELNSLHLAPVDAGAIGDDGMWLLVQTTQSRVDVALAARTRVFGDEEIVPLERGTQASPGLIAQELVVEVTEGEALSVEKVVHLSTSRDRAISDAGLEARSALPGLPRFADALEQHVLAWDQLWRRFRLRTDADEETRRNLCAHVFHLLQTTSKHTISLDAGVPARGWHGEAYRGHIFWDELFIFPFLNLHLPDLTRALLYYRYRRLRQARRAAAAAGLEGALFPWQSGSNGREETQVVHLNPRSGNWLPDNSHLQRHINIAVAYNVWQYYQATGDLDFMAFYGAELMVEIASMWSSLATYNKALDRYEIHQVMGPDEYHDAYPDADEPGLRNNAYTNVMVAWLLRRAREALDMVPGFRHQELVEKLGVRRKKLERWDDISRKIVVPFHGEGIISQFEGYEHLEEFDWDGYRERYGDIHRLDRILEAEGDTPNRYKVSKQADVLMLFYLLSARELEGLLTRLGYPWDPDLISRNVEYYLARTSHGSTLSRVVHAWVHAREDRLSSWTFFQEALASDINDIQGGTTAEGIHLGAMAGSVDLVQRGYTGLETRNGVLRFDPAIPEELGRLEFHVRYRGAWVEVEVETDRVALMVAPGAPGPIRVAVGEEEFELAPGIRRELVS